MTGDVHIIEPMINSQYLEKGIKGLPARPSGCVGRLRGCDIEAAWFST